MDVSRLAEEMGMDEDDIQELLTLFHETSIADILKLEEALEQKNCETVRKAAHSIKGASGNMQLMDIYEIAKTAESEAINRRLNRIPEYVHQIKEKLHVLDSFLRSIQ